MVQSDSTSNKTRTPQTADGFMLGQSATDLVGIHGATPVAQRAGAAQAAVVTTTPTNSSPYGFTLAQATALITLVNELRAAMVEKGFIAGA